MKIVVKDNRVISLKEFFQKEKLGRLQLAHLSFEDKIAALKMLQRIARTWGGKKDVIVWR